MTRILFDEDLDRRITRGLRRRRPDIEFSRVEDMGLVSAEDPDILEAAAQNSMLVVTHDANTMTAYAYDRLRAGKSMPGLIVVRQETAIGAVIEDLILIFDLLGDGEW